MSAPRDVADSDDRRDDVLKHIKEAAESLGMTVGPVIIPDEAMQQAAADRLELAEVAINEASGDVRSVILDFEPLSRRNGNKWSDRQDDPLWLLTPDEYERIPDGTELVCISGKRGTKGIDYIDQDTRAGFIAWGLLDSQFLVHQQNDGQVQS